MIGFVNICLSTNTQSSLALHNRGQRLTSSLLFGSTLNADESFCRGCSQPFIDLCKAFDSVNHNAFWMILGLRGVLPKLINLISELYSGTKSAVRCDDTISDISCCNWSSSEVCTGPHTFQHLYGLDSGEDVGEIKLWCIIWECQDL